MKPARCSRWRKPPRSFMRRAACCMSMRSRRLGKYLLISMRLNADLGDAFGAQDRRPQGRRRRWFWPRACRGWSRCCAAAARSWAAGREPKTSPGLRDLARPSRLPWPARKRTPSGSKACGTGSKTACGRPPVSSSSPTDVPRLPNTTLFTVPGLKAETAVIGFDLAGIAVSSGLGLFLGQGAAFPCAGGHGISAPDSRKERCGSVWAGPPQTRTSIAALRLGEGSPVTLLRGSGRNTA